LQNDILESKEEEDSILRVQKALYEKKTSGYEEGKKINEEIKEMTAEEKTELKANIEKLEFEQKSGILPIVRDYLKNKDRANNSPHLV